MKNAFEIVRDFENAVAEYTGAPFCVSVNSCTNALFLTLKYQYERDKDNFGVRYYNREPVKPFIEIPKRTYLSVPMQIKHSGFEVRFRDEKWKGAYKLEPYWIYDAARKFTSDMYYDIYGRDGAVKTCWVCVSFHWSKILGIQQGGAILHNDKNFDIWARKARFDGRTEGVKPKDDNPILGYHMYMSPEIAAEGLVRLMHLPKYNPDLPNDDYPDLSKLEIFK